MDAHVYKIIELAGSSGTSIDDAIKNAVARASKHLRNLRWLEVVDVRGHLEDNKIAQWQVKLKVGFTLEE